MAKYLGRYAPYTVVLSAHAKQRLTQYLGTTRGAKDDISRRLTSALKLGVEPGPDLGVEIRMEEGWRAECYPVDAGYWVCATVIPPEWWDEEQEALRRAELAGEAKIAATKSEEAQECETQS